MAEGKADVRAARENDFENMIFDGQKADLFINTGRLNGQVFLVQVQGADREPTLIAIHL
jgi:hypothetical protein